MTTVIKEPGVGVWVPLRHENVFDYITEDGDLGHAHGWIGCRYGCDDDCDCSEYDEDNLLMLWLDPDSGDFYDIWVAGEVGESLRGMKRGSRRYVLLPEESR